MRSKTHSNFIRMRSRLKGFTLIELLVGVTVGVMVLGTVAALFVPSLGTYRTSQAISSIQENERFSINALTRSINQAGFIGCDSTEPQNLINVTNLPVGGVAWAAQAASPIQILSAELDASVFIGGIPLSDKDIQGNDRLKFSGQTIGDVIVTISGGSDSSLLINHNSANETVTFRGNLAGVLDDKLLLINDCNITTLFQVGAGTYDAPTLTTIFSYAEVNTDINCNATSVSPNRVLLGGDANANCTSGTALYADYTFASGASSVILTSTAYYLADSFINPGTPSLYSVTINAVGAFGTPIELIIGVDNLRARYGVLGSTGTITYVSPNTFTGFTGTDVDGDATLETFRNVALLEVNLMLNSSVGKRERGDDEKQVFSFMDTSGNIVDCDTATTSTLDTSACPGYLFADATATGRYRRVVTKVFNLRNITL